MQFDGASAIVTGAGQGIGLSLAKALAARGVRVLTSDLSSDLAEQAAHSVGGVPHAGDLCDPDVIASMVETAETEFGRVDMLFSNAGFALGEPDGPTSQTDSHWQDSWDIHVMAHLRASRRVLPQMIARGSGVLVNVASAAGLLSQIGDAAYSATKHAAVSLAQSLAIEHGHQGIQVSVVCPLYVATPLLGYDHPDDANIPDRVITPDEVAQATIAGVEGKRFMIYPHPEAQAFFQKRATDTDRWIAGMQRLRAAVKEQTSGTDPAALHRFI
ncbi:SDR family NAD(P)-dependent oxidoreductase [Marivita hallyeonensis]|uniref:Short-chain dehydrogenase n=1 Tax=Marivita hallyeonensis TaxID=996342 RepID=A0A1M5UCH7_9RHOB|nr:SDR family oxidoreductase [Marivita hallyeonensis]SHH60649.1 Short-chain dehydrogenase [Marivita hallyeonensis]